MITIKNIAVGDEVGLRSTTNRKNNIYRIEKVTKVTAKQIVTESGTYWRDNGKPVGMKGHGRLEAMTPQQIQKWREEKAAEEKRLAEKRAAHRPEDDDDCVQAALRALRKKTRVLCEKLKAEADARLDVNVGSSRWWEAYLDVEIEIERSKSALAD